MDAIYELQRTLYTGVLDAIRMLQANGWSELPGLVVAAFGFGMLHALLPGHGKSVLMSYYAGDGRLRGALFSSAILIATHVGTAVLLVVGGFALLQRTIAGAGRAPALEFASQTLIVAIGALLLWRALRRRSRADRKSGAALGLVAGLVPCPLTTFIMTYAVANSLVAAGLVLSGTFALGMILTVAAFPLLAVVLRTRLLSAMTHTEAWRNRVGRCLEVAAAMAVTALGLWPLLRNLLWA